jgi:PiT family inorganic phosphate transporter
MDQSTLFIICIILLAYCFDFINGFHDAGNAIASIVTTGVLTPRQAVLWAAFFNFAALAFFNLMVAKTIGQGIISPEIISPKLLFSALTAAISWGLITWYYGIPASSSLALMGGLSGAAIVHGGVTALQCTGLIKIAIGIFIFPLIGVIGGLCLTVLFKHRAKQTNKPITMKQFHRLQLLSSALLSLAHGGNDAQKTMGIITMLLFSAGWLTGSFHIPFWVVLSCQTTISLGTLFGGWRIVHTMGTKITTLDNLHGCAAQTAAALIILAATGSGIPVSTTQTVTGAIAGTGLLSELGGTQWPMVRIIFASWLLTIPATSLFAALMMAVA